MIQKFIESIEKLLAASPIILSSDIQKHFGPHNNVVYITGSILFIDSSILEISLFVEESPKAILFDKYRFHYMNNRGDLLFRYDNAPHHPELSSFPNHKHIGNRIFPAPLPDVKNILNEISALLLKT